MSPSSELENSAPEVRHPSLLARAALLVPLWAAVVIAVVILIAALPARANKWDYSIYYSSALAMRSASATVVVIGFSRSTCLPAAMASTARSAWLAGGVRTSTASTSACASSPSVAV